MAVFATDHLLQVSPGNKTTLREERHVFVSSVGSSLLGVFAHFVLQGRRKSMRAENHKNLGEREHKSTVAEEHTR